MFPTIELGACHDARFRAYLSPLPNKAVRLYIGLSKRRSRVKSP